MTTPRHCFERLVSDGGGVALGSRAECRCYFSWPLWDLRFLAAVRVHLHPRQRIEREARRRRRHLESMGARRTVLVAMFPCRKWDLLIARLHGRPTASGS